MRSLNKKAARWRALTHCGEVGGRDRVIDAARGRRTLLACGRQALEPGPAASQQAVGISLCRTGYSKFDPDMREIQHLCTSQSVR